jgi:uncharacterized membrane protein SpoIIM required for sporulation
MSAIAELRKIFPRVWMRLYFIVLVGLVLIALIGSAVPLDEAQSREVLEQAEEIIPETINTQAIFLNNLRAALIIMIPGVGAILGGIIIYSTGLVFGAVGQSLGIFGPGLILLVALTPFFWLEFLAYSASMTQSLFIGYGIYRGGIRKEAIRTVVLLAFVILSLLLGAFVEILFIR